MPTPTLADGVAAVVKAACDPLHARIEALERRLAKLEAPKSDDDADAIRARTAALRQTAEIRTKVAS